MMHSEIEILRWDGDQARTCRDTIAVEEPLEIAVNGESLAVTMRTPGDDFALAAGFLFAEGIVTSGADIGAIAHSNNPDDPERHNLVTVSLKSNWKREDDAARLERNFLATSSCGVCGKANLEAVRCVAPPLSDSDFRVSVGVIRSLNDKMRAAQRTFDRTGGLHAAALFDSSGELLSLREDVGRHNALDKLIGTEVMANRVPLSDRILMVSGRTSFEILQKAAVARLPVVCAVSAPSSQAVQLAQDLNITLIGFLRGDTMNVYAHPNRIAV